MTLAIDSLNLEDDETNKPARRSPNLDIFDKRSLDIDLGERPTTRLGKNIEFADWEIPSRPIGRGTFSPRWTDSFIVSPPVSSGRNKAFPDFAVLDPNTVGAFAQSLRYSQDRGLGALKQFVPGLSFVGDVLGRIGKTIEDSPFGKSLEAPAQFLTGGAGALASGAIHSLASAKNILLKSGPLSLPLGAIREGIKATGGDQEVGELRVLTETLTPEYHDFAGTLGEAASALSLFPAFKGASLLIKGAGAIPIASDFGSGVTRALTRRAVNDSVSFKAGQFAGRVTLATQATGLAAEFTLPKVDPDETWSREIMTNRVVAEDSPWRFPWEAASSLALDLPGLIHFARANKAASLASQKAFGAAPRPSQIRLGNDAIRNALDAGVLSNAELNLLDDVAIRQTSERYFVRSWSEAFGIEARTAHDLPLTQAELNLGIKRQTDLLYKKLGPAQFHREAADTMLEDFGKNIGDWNSLDASAQIQQFRTYADMVRRFESSHPGMLVGVASDAAFAKLQSADALAYVKNSLAHGTWDATTQANFANNFPAIANREVIASTLEDGPRLLSELMGIAGGGNADELASIGMQIGKIEARLANETVPAGMVRLYRGERQAIHAKGIGGTAEQIAAGDFSGGNRGRWFTDVPDKATRYGPNTKFVDVPAADAAKYRQPNMDNTFILPAETAAQASEVAGPDLYQKLTDLEARQALLLEPPVGALQATLDRLLKKIVLDGQINLAGEAKALQAKIKAARASQAAEIEKKIAVVEDSIFARESEAALAQGDAFDDVVINAEADALHAQRSRLIQEWADTSLAGSRWAMTYSPSGPLMRLTDDLGEDYFKSVGAVRGERTAFGEIFDKLFGGLPSKQIGMTANKFVMEHVGSANGPIKTTEFLDELKKKVTDSGVELGTGHIWSPVMNVWHVSPIEINAIAKRLEMIVPPGFKSMSEVIYRAYPGPLKIFQEQVLGRELVRMPYLQGFHHVTRTLYPQYRFSFSPRFLGMNVIEPWILGTALGGTKFLRGKPTERILEMAKNWGIDDIEGYLAHGGTIRIGEAQTRNLAKAVYSRRPDEIVEGFLDVIAAQPEMEGVLKTLGNRRNWVAELDNMLESRTNALAARASKTAEETTLAAQIEELGKSIKTGSSGEQVIAREQLTKLQDEYLKLRADRTVDEAWQAIDADLDKYRPFIASMKNTELQVLKDMRQMFYGNPSRGSAERLANSFLAYWPVSYLAKTSKVLGDFMFHKPFGIRANALGAVSYGKLYEDVQQAIQDDPEVAAFFKENDQALFLIRQMIPLEPSGLGVTLSPFVRVPKGIATGEISPAQAVQRFNQGPAYDLSLLQRVVSEQQREGIFQGIFGSRD